MRTLIHYGMHLLAPAGIALIISRKKWLMVYLIFLGAMLIDLDHLLASPIFDPERCSIGFHPLHSHIAIGAYAILSVIPKTRIIGMALLWHVLTDAVDCGLMNLWG
ncbi:MAG: DUF6122 family protein [Bacteroidota bacterium]